MNDSPETWRVEEGMIESDSVVVSVGRFRVFVTVGADVCQNRAMADWIDEHAEQVLNRQKQQRTEEELQLHKAEIVKAKARAVLDALTAQVQKDFERYDAKFPN